ncbi:hypothetical protein [Synechococcus sp. BA-132 BA5]|uniref:hypothetical protein n=1 Tax=Synechococcus sp. BA-132 BA5 TaxID=3110252 RepID=UPI002B1F1460|nr:hypothetical protein [Synechococcus sp. BA-132 BA5]MEA5414229.1 hypothetical protein [Synechococcus sp. BA-132 BA5]
MAHLFTIGDSISQGFRSGCTAFSEHAYSTYLSEALGITKDQYRISHWPEIKLKFDLEAIFRLIQKRFGNDVSNLEWLPLLAAVSSFLDKSEEYYERGDGKIGTPIPKYNYDFMDNCAYEGMRVADAWEVTPALCKDRISADLSSIKNDRGLAVASQPFYRSAYRVLNPQAKTQYNSFSALSWLEHLAIDEGVENTIVFLGANNALGTIFDLKVKMSLGTGGSHGSRLGADELRYNLWHPKDFLYDYSQLIDRLCDAQKQNQVRDWKVYLGTVPLVTIAAILEGFGEERLVDDPEVPLGQAERQFRYYQYYKYYGVRDETAVRDERKHMAFRDALFIDKVIIEYNRSIARLAAAKNKALSREAFIVVDISKVLTDMAWKRNSGMPRYELPPELAWVYPPLNTKFYRVDAAGKMADGGVFGLDGIHPTVIGQGLIAWEFLKAFQKHGSASADAFLNWDRIIKDDELYQNPIAVIRDIVENDEAVNFLVQVVSLLPT